MNKVAILYPADPMGVVPGGIDTFIRGILRWAPDDLEISLVGVSTDKACRPVGRWTNCDLGKRQYRFYPVAYYGNPAGRGRIPLVIKFMLGLLRYRPHIDADILEFHRIEPSLLYYFDPRSKNAFFHQNMQILHNSQSDILWSKLPVLYFWVQDRLMRRLSSVYAVRRDGVEFCKQRYPDIADRFNFVPTWFDPEVFNPVDETTRKALRLQLGLGDKDELLVTVGRLDTQKNPLLLAQTFKRIVTARPDARLWYIGDGVLRESLEAFLKEECIDHQVTLMGLKSAAQIADILRAADLFVLSSVYEGMPMCVLEALGSGLPVVTTDVGEVKLAVLNGVSGEVIEDQSEELLAAAVLKVLDNKQQYGLEAVAESVSEFTPEKVLAPIYENYRSLAAKKQPAE